MRIKEKAVKETRYKAARRSDKKGVRTEMRDQVVYCSEITLLGQKQDIKTEYKGHFLFK